MEAMPVTDTPEETIQNPATTAETESQSPPENFLDDPDVQAVINEYNATSAADLDLNIEGVKALLQEYSQMKGQIQSEVIVRQLMNLTKPEKESQASDTTNEVEKATETSTSETKAEKPEPAKTREIDHSKLEKIVEQAREFIENVRPLAESDVTAPDFYALLKLDGSSRPAPIRIDYLNVLKKVHPDLYPVLISSEQEIRLDRDKVADFISTRTPPLDMTVDQLLSAGKTITAVTQVMNRAYDVLSNPVQKELYDWFHKNRDLKLSNGQTALQMYFSARDDNQRREWMQRWEGQLKQQQEDPSIVEQRRKRKEYEDKVWEAKQREAREKSTAAERRKAQFEKKSYAFTFIDFVEMRTLNEAAMEDRFRNMSREDADRLFSSARNSTFEEFLKNVLDDVQGADSTAYMKYYGGLYQEMVKNKERLTVRFKDGNLVTYSPEQMLELFYEAVKKPVFRFSSFQFNPKLEQALAGLAAAPEELGLTAIITALEEQRPNNIDIFAHSDFNDMIKVLLQIKAKVNLSQTLGKPFRISEVIDLCSQLPDLNFGNNGDLSRLILKATMEELLHGNNPFNGELAFDLA